MKKLIIITFALIIQLKAAPASADFSVAESSAQLKVEQNLDLNDQRIIILKNYLKNHQSPLSDYSELIVKVSDNYSLDWRLIPAISGVESTFGKNIPSNSYNAYGWNNGKYQFQSWEESIETVAKTLKEKYIDRGAVSLNRIAGIYAPGNGTWSGKVKYFINEIEPFPLDYSL